MALIFNMKIDEWEDSVKGCLVSILMEENNVSEKSFSRVDEMCKTAEALIMKDKKIVNSFKKHPSRPALCAEIIYFRTKNENL